MTSLNPATLSRRVAALALALAMALGPLAAPIAVAADPPPAEAYPEPNLPPPGPAPPADQVDALAREFGRKLRCPVCQGLSVADSQSEAAQIMFARVRELVAAGYTEEQIQDYWIARYGEWVLLEPQGRHWIVWVGPGLVGGAAVAWLMAVVARWRREEDDVPLPSDVGLTDKDPYEERLLAELEKR